MGRIRSVKPELFRHEDLFQAEKESGLPLRLAFIGLFTVCDREGRFKWRPVSLKLDVLPYDQIDFSDVLNKLWTRGFIEKYEVDGDVFGCIPTWNAHQVINHKEKQSTIPQKTNDNEILPTREARVAHASPRVDHDARGDLEGKGREGELEGKGKEPQVSRVKSQGGKKSAMPTASPSAKAGPLIALYCDLWKIRYNSPRSPDIDGSSSKQFKRLLDDLGNDRAHVLVRAYLQMADSWFVTKRHDVWTLMKNLNAVSLFADSGRMITKSETSQLDKAVTNQNTLHALRNGEI